jgi:hypothetical protein
MMNFDRFETRVTLLILVLLGAICTRGSPAQRAEALDPHHSMQFFRLQVVTLFAVAPSSRRDPAQHASKE